MRVPNHGHAPLFQRLVARFTLDSIVERRRSVLGIAPGLPHAPAEVTGLGVYRFRRLFRPTAVLFFAVRRWCCCCSSIVLGGKACCRPYVGANASERIPFVSCFSSRCIFSSPRKSRWKLFVNDHAGEGGEMHMKCSYRQNYDSQQPGCYLGLCQN